MLSNSISIYSYSNNNENMKVTSLSIWEMNSIWNEILNEQQSISLLIFSNLFSLIILIPFILFIYFVSKI